MPVSAFKDLDLDLPEGSIEYGDKAYTNNEEEELLLEASDIKLKPQRKNNAKRHLDVQNRSSIGRDK